MGASQSRPNPTIQGNMTFPMYTTSIEIVLDLAWVQPHEELLEAGKLTVFDETKGHAIFASHQWAAHDHPDPTAEQFKVLQRGLTNLLADQTRVSLPIVSEVFYGRMKTPTGADLSAKPLYVWYDYFSVPQAATSSRLQNYAIDNIANYVARSDYFVVLCPGMLHAQTKQLLSHSTWAQRGWCRLERLASELAPRSSGFLIVVESPESMTLVDNRPAFLNAPGGGDFTVESDRARIGHCVYQLLWNKLQQHLQDGDMHGYRFLLNRQVLGCLKNLSVVPVEGLIPNFRPQADPFTDEQRFAVERFLHENGFGSVSERDEAGWTPICYAAMSGSKDLIEALLSQGATANDMITKPKKELLMEPGMSALSIAAYLRNNTALVSLMLAKAPVHSKDGRGATALHWACTSDNAEGIRILCAAGADVLALDSIGGDPLREAVSIGSVAALRELLRQDPTLSVSHRLHYALIINGGSIENVSALIEVRADVNEQYCDSPVQAKIILQVAALMHRFSPSRMTYFCYHAYMATPLMISIIAGYYDASYLLLAEGARTDPKNYRDQTAAELAREVMAPVSLIQALEWEQTVWSVPYLPAKTSDEDIEILPL